jgi:hypothetical protein
MQQTNGPHALRVAGRYAKDNLNHLMTWWKSPTAEEKDAWLQEHHPWAIPMIEKVIAEALAEHRTRQGKEAGHE